MKRGFRVPAARFSAFFIVLVLVSMTPIVKVSASTNISLVWSKTIPGVINESSPMPVTINGNKDIVIGAWDGDVHVLRGTDGSEEAGWPRYTGHKIDSSASSGDVNGDGKPEIFIGSGIADVKCSGGSIWSFNQDGTTRFNETTPDDVAAVGPQCQDPSIQASPALGDITHSGTPDITFGALGLKSWSLNANGGRNLNWPFYWDDTQYGSPALTDLTGDGQIDAVMPGDSSPGGPVDWQGGMVRAMTGYGQNLWTFYTNEIVRSSPSVGDVVGNGDNQIVFGTGNFWAHNGGASDSTKVFVLNRDGSLHCKIDVGAEVMASPTIADFDGDGTDDIAFGTWQSQSGSNFYNDGKVWEMNGNCQPKAGFPIDSGGFLVLGQITTADINNSGHQDLIVPTANGVHAFDGKTGASLFTLNQGIASYKNAPLVEDVDNNGQLDIIIAGTEGDGTTGLIQRYEIGPSVGSVLGANGWPMFRRDPQLTGSWTSAPISDPPSGTAGQGYWLFTADGGVWPMGSAKPFGSAGNLPLTAPIVGGKSTPDGQGYWLVGADGGVFTYGDAHYYGSEGGKRLNKPIVGLVPTPDGLGYWLVAADGGVFPFGDAAGHGSTGNIALRQPIVGMASSKTGNGYWLVAADGGVFPFGDAAGHGSTGNIQLRQPMIGMAVSPTGNGYWLVASDGGVFPFGDAGSYGSAGNLKLVSPIKGVAASPSGGYFFAAGDGGIFTYNANYYGSLSGVPLAKPVIGVSMVGN